MNSQTVERARSFVEGRAEAEERLDFAEFVHRTYATEAVYTAAYGGVLEVSAQGPLEILKTHYGRDMSLGWEGWTWPCRGIYLMAHEVKTNGVPADGVSAKHRAVVHWVNLAPGERTDGSAYETPGVSFLEFDDAGKVVLQSDIMDLGAQLGLCDELDRAGLLNAALRASWVDPMKKMLIDALS